MKLTEQQYGVLCIALVESRREMEDSIRRLKYALDQTTGLNVNQMDYRERIAAKLVVYEQRVKLINDVIVEVGKMYDER